MCGNQVKYDKFLLDLADKIMKESVVNRIPLDGVEVSQNKNMVTEFDP